MEEAVMRSPVGVQEDAAKDLAQCATNISIT